MTRQEPTLFESLQKWNIAIQKVIKYLNKNKIPNDYKGIKNMLEELESEEQRRNEMNRMRERIKKLQRDKRQRERWIKLERRRKIRKFLHLPYKTLNEDDFFKSFEE